MISGGDENGLMSEINVTPFVDVMLVLLIIFMVAAPMMTQGVDVALPETTSGALSTEDTQLILSINKNEEIFINDFQVSQDYLQDKMRRILDGRKDKKVFLRADKAVPYGMVVRVMADIKNAGVEKIGMITNPVDERE